jgi:hypothetical protein
LRPLDSHHFKNDFDVFRINPDFMMRPWKYGDPLPEGTQMLMGPAREDFINRGYHCLHGHARIFSCDYKPMCKVVGFRIPEGTMVPDESN